MRLSRRHEKWTWPWPETWLQVFGTLALLLLGFLAVAYALDWLRGVL